MTLSRRRFIRIFAATAAVAPFGASAFASARPGLHRWQGVALGAGASVTLAGVSAKRAEALIARARAEMERLEGIFSLYRAESALSRLNRDGRLNAPPPDMTALLSMVDGLHTATDGAFDPSVQPLWRLLAETGGAARAEARAEALELVGWRHVAFDAGHVRLARPDMALTLNGIAQGYATDRVAALLKAEGLENALVSVGEVAALGPRAPGVPWEVGLADAETDAADEVVPLHTGAVATSAPAGTVLSADGAIGHILDPRHGVTEGAWRRVSVLHPSAAIADGLSTAAVLMATPEIKRAARLYPEARVRLVSREGERVWV